MKYEDFLQTKQLVAHNDGIEIDDSEIHPTLFGFQRDLVRWSLAKGRAALFADTGILVTPLPDNRVHESSQGSTCLRTMRSEVRTVAQPARTGTRKVLLQGVCWSSETPPRDPVLRSLRLTPRPLGVGSRKRGEPLLLTGVLSRMAGGQPKPEHLPEDGRRSRPSRGSGEASGASIATGRSGPSRRRGQAQLRSVKPSGSSEPIGPHEASLREDAG